MGWFDKGILLLFLAFEETCLLKRCLARLFGLINGMIMTVPLLLLLFDVCRIYSFWAYCFRTYSRECILAFNENLHKGSRSQHHNHHHHHHRPQQQQCRWRWWPPPPHDIVSLCKAEEIWKHLLNIAVIVIIFTATTTIIIIIFITITIIIILILITTTTTTFIQVVITVIITLSNQM